MFKHDFIRVVAKKTGKTIAVSEAMIDAVLDSILEILKGGEEVSLQHFGKFFLQDTSQRVVKSPMVDEPIIVPACKRMRFKFFDSAIAKE